MAAMTPKPDHGEESYEGCGKLEGRAAIITGDDSGVGRAVAIAFAREGADVLISYLPEEEDDARETARWVEQAGRCVVLLPGDIADQQHCRKIVERCVAEFGKLDVLVNNAAVQRTYEKLEDITAEEWERTFRVNVHAMFYMSQAAVPHMGPGAAIVNTTSIQSKDPSPQLLAYRHQGSDLELHRRPGPNAGRPRHPRQRRGAGIWTPLIPSTMPAEKAASFGQQGPLSRAGQPKEVAPAFVLLASGEASYISGAVVPVTGGQTML